MQIRYIGHKAKKLDNVANTGIAWLGHGDVQEVEDPIAAAKLLACDTIWSLFDPEADGASLPADDTPPVDVIDASLVRSFIAMLLAADRLSIADLPTACAQLGIDPASIPVPAIAPPPADAPPEAKFVLDGPDGPVVLDAMDDEALKEFAASIKVHIDLRLKGDKRRGAIVDAIAAAAAAAESDKA